MRQGLAFHKLHRVEMNAALAANKINRNNVRVLKVSSRLRLVLESLELLRVEGSRKGKNFERYAPAERDLDGLVDDPHAAPADFTHDSKVAQRGFRLDNLSLGKRGRGFLQTGRGDADEIQAIKTLRQ